MAVFSVVRGISLEVVISAVSVARFTSADSIPGSLINLRLIILAQLAQCIPETEYRLVAGIKLLETAFTTKIVTDSCIIGGKVGGARGKGHVTNGVYNCWLCIFEGRETG